MTDSKTFRTVGMAMFLVAAGAIISRIVLNLLPITNPWLEDTIFSLMVQVGFFLVGVFCLYRFRLKQSTAAMMEFSNVRKTKKINIGLAVALGFFCFFSTIGISAVWQVILMIFQYKHTVPEDNLPEKFNAGLLILSIFLTGILPAICEEFAMRGGFLTVLRESFTQKQVIIISAVAFGLFHSYIPQFGYTMVFGAVMAYLVITTKSIYPAMIVHFINNTINVYLEFAEKYGWWGGDLMAYIQAGLTVEPLSVFIAYLIILASTGGLLYLIFVANKHNTMEKKINVLKRAGYDHTNKRVAIVGDFDEEVINEIELEKNVFGSNYRKSLYKPSLRDCAFYYGAVVITVAATIFSYIWGLF